jgi:hypothetical protein
VRNSAFLTAALLAAFGAACRRAPAPAPEDDASIPLPSTTTLAAADAVVNSSFTNEMQAQMLRQEAAKLGIDELSRPGEPGADTGDPRPPISYEEGLARTKRYTKEFEAERRALDSKKPKTVILPGNTPDIIPVRKAGAPIENSEDSK